VVARDSARLEAATMARAARDLAAEAAVAAVRRKEMQWLWREGGRSRPTRSRRPWGRRDPGGGGGGGVRGSEEGEVRRRGSGRREEADGRGGSGIGFGDLLYEANTILAVRSKMNGLK
jgi:hypothetical protein